MIHLRLLAALAVLSGIAKDMPRAEAERVARESGFLRRGSSGKVRHALNLRGMSAYNFHENKEQRNAAKARRRAIRAAA